MRAVCAARITFPNSNGCAAARGAARSPAAQPQNEHIELWQKRHGKRFDHDERLRKKQARAVHTQSHMAQKLRGIKAKIYSKKRREEKVQMKKTIKMHEEKKSKKEKAPSVPEGAIPAYLMDRCVPARHASRSLIN